MIFPDNSASFSCLVMYCLYWANVREKIPATKEVIIAELLKSVKLLSLRLNMLLVTLMLEVSLNTLVVSAMYVDM